MRESTPEEVEAVRRLTAALVEWPRSLAFQVGDEQGLNIVLLDADGNPYLDLLPDEAAVLASFDVYTDRTDW